MAISTILPQQAVPPAQPPQSRTSGALVLNINAPLSNYAGDVPTSGANAPAASAVSPSPNSVADTFQRRNSSPIAPNPASPPREQLEQLYLNALNARNDAEQARNYYLNLANQLNNQAYVNSQTQAPAMPQAPMQAPAAAPQGNPLAAQQFQEQLNQLQQMQQAQLQQQQQQFQQQLQQQQAQQQAQIQQLQQQMAKQAPPQPQAPLGMDPAMQQQMMMQQMQQPQAPMGMDPAMQQPQAPMGMDPALQQQMMMQQMQQPQAPMGMDPAMQQQMMMQQMQQPQAPMGMDPALQQQMMMQQMQQPQAPMGMDPAMQQQMMAQQPGQATGNPDYQTMRPEELNMVIASPQSANQKLGAILEFAARQQGNRETYELLKREAMAPTNELPPGQAQEDGNLIRQAALFALGNLNRAQNSQVETVALPGLDAINTILKNPKENPAVKAAAVTALGYIDRPNDPVIKGLLNRAAKDSNQDVKNAVQQVKAGLMGAATQG